LDLRTQVQVDQTSPLHFILESYQHVVVLQAHQLLDVGEVGKELEVSHFDVVVKDLSARDQQVFKEHVQVGPGFLVA